MTEPKTINVPIELFDRVTVALATAFAAATYLSNPDQNRDNAYKLMTEFMTLRQNNEKNIEKSPS